MYKDKDTKELENIFESLTVPPTPEYLAQLTQELPSKSLDGIASLISRDWRNVNFAAKPYLSAMFSLNQITDKYGFDSGASIVAYFLANAGSWKGEVAKVIKKELNNRLKAAR